MAIDAICTFAGDGNGEVTGEVKKTSNFKHFEGTTSMKTIMHRLINVVINPANLYFVQVHLFNAHEDSETE